MIKVKILNCISDSQKEEYYTFDNINIKSNNHIIYLVVKHYLSNQRQATSATKSRGNITGSNKKIQKQKGTGNARKGSIKNPIFRGGGIIFGPKNHNYKSKINKKTKYIARKLAFIHQLKKNNVIITNNIKLETPSTKYMVNYLDKIKLTKSKNLIIIPNYDKILLLSIRNLVNTNLITVKDLNTYCIMNTEKLIFTLDSINMLASMFNFIKK